MNDFVTGAPADRLPTLVRTVPDTACTTRP